MKSKLHLLVWCLAFGIIAFVCLDIWSARNQPLFQKFETQWREDTEQLEDSGKMPKAWFDVRDLVIIGGTPETKDWLARVKVPLKTKKDGHYHLEALVVVWEEDGKRGALVQYNLEDLKTKNNIFELGRTFILSVPKPKDPFKAFLAELHL